MMPHHNDITVHLSVIFDFPYSIVSHKICVFELWKNLTFSFQQNNFHDDQKHVKANIISANADTYLTDMCEITLVIDGRVIVIIVQINYL